MLITTSINITLSRENTPIAYQNKLDELMDCKAFDTQAEAEAWLNETPIELNYTTKTDTDCSELRLRLLKIRKSSHHTQAHLYWMKMRSISLTTMIIQTIQKALNDDLLKSILEISNNNQEIPEYKIDQILFSDQFGKNIGYSENIL